MIHTFTKDLFIREKVWSKMNDYERVLLKLIAKEICMQPTLIRFESLSNILLFLLCLSPLNHQWASHLPVEWSSCDSNFRNLRISWASSIVSHSQVFVRAAPDPNHLERTCRSLIIRYLRDQNHRNLRAQKQSPSGKDLLSSFTARPTNLNKCP
jgi:hypothetical protein